MLGVRWGFRCVILTSVFEKHVKNNIFRSCRERQDIRRRATCFTDHDNHSQADIHQLQHVQTSFSLLPCCPFALSTCVFIIYLNYFLTIIVSCNVSKWTGHPIQTCFCWMFWIHVFEVFLMLKCLPRRKISFWIKDQTMRRTLYTLPQCFYLIKHLFIIDTHNCHSFFSQ